MTWRWLENAMHLSSTEAPIRLALFNHVAMDGDELLRRYQAYGGIAGGDQLANLLNDRVDQAISVVARWIVDHRVISFSLRGQLLLPVFQFESTTLLPRREVVMVLDELSQRLNDTDIAAWFVSPEARLGGQLPIDVLQRDTAAVQHAARTV
jgi:hypothetical protein